MPRFQYTALSAEKKTVKGTVTAENSFAARKQLRVRGIHPTSIKQTAEQGDSRFSIMAVSGRKRKADLIEFTKELSVLLHSEIKLTEALSVLIQQCSDVRFKNAVIDIRDRVVTGESFADIISEYSDYFDLIYISMVRVGEATGTLAATLGTIARFMEKRAQIESKIITAMIYPMFIFFMGTAAMIFLTTFVIPKIIVQIEKAGQQLPWITRALMNISYVLTNWWFVVAAVIIAIGFGWRRFVRTDKGAMLKDRLLLSLPIFGPLLKQKIVSRFASTLSTLLSSGLSMAESLRVVAEVTGNRVMCDAVKKARERILSGADIATPLHESGVISPAIAHMVAVGEKSGELDKMLKNISDNLEASSDVVVERLSAAIEPLIIILMAVFVGIIAYATLLPILRFSAGQF